MRVAASVRRALLGLACGLLAAAACAGERCRITFDIGSSGIRAGASNSSVTTRTDIDYLGPLLAGRGLEETVAGTIAALRELPKQGGFSADCARVGGGFSAWRIALGQDTDKLAGILASIETASGVAVLVPPQNVEGRYGYFAAHQLLGGSLRTSHVLDIGGGSMQISGERSSYGDELGQKIWHRALCDKIRATQTQTCTLQPMSDAELATARSLLAEKLQGIGAALPQPVTMTAISPPVTRGVLPALERLSGKGPAHNTVQRSALSAAIEKTAGLTLEETGKLFAIQEKYAAYLLSDMLLVEGLLQATGGEDLEVSEIDLTNLPGLLADDRAFAWRGHYGCYLQRLRQLGLAAYASDPESCGNEEFKTTQ
jgi:hypothetical protein